MTQRQGICYKCGGQRTNLANSISRPEYASHTEDECIIHLRTRLDEIEETFKDHRHELLSGNYVTTRPMLEGQ